MGKRSGISSYLRLRCFRQFAALDRQYLQRIPVRRRAVRLRPQPLLQPRTLLERELNIIGTVGAHELLHRMGIGDLKPYDPNNPTDLMSVDVDPNFEKVLINNSLKLTQAEAKRLQTDCLEKHLE